VAGHLAWVAPHDVLIQWGSVQIGVSSSRVTGDNSTPLLSKTELLKIAAGLTVADSNAVGHGYPLATAVPDSAFDYADRANAIHTRSDGGRQITSASGVASA
jgi:hypothetical protein